jgi:hypothetical protein
MNLLAITALPTVPEHVSNIHSGDTLRPLGGMSGGVQEMVIRE